MRVTIKDAEARSILVRSKLPDTDYVVNPYTGCAFGCLYCYASFMGRFVNEPIDRWGDYVHVKTNAVALFTGEVARLRRSGASPSILVGSVTDPYQGVESKHRLTRGILEVLTIEPYPGLVSVLTKSPLVLRDVDLLRRLPRAEVGLTVTTTDDKISRFLEVRAPVASQRLKALEALHAQGIETYAFVGPLLPHFRYEPDALDALFSELARVRVSSIFVEHMNLRPYIRRRLLPVIGQEPAEVQKVYGEVAYPAHREALDAIVTELVRKYNLKLRMNKVLRHDSDMRST